MRKYVVFAFFLSIQSIMNAEESVINLRKRLTSFFQKQALKYHIPGMSVALVYKNRIVYAQGFGFANRELRKRATAHTVYNVGSISKVVTATAIMRLIERDLVQFNKPIYIYLPAFGMRWRHPNRLITVWDLLTHYSGLPRSLPGRPHLRRNYRFSDSLQTIVKRTAKTMHLKYPPHTRYSYSNLGFTLLGRIIENVTRQPFAYFMQHSLFRLLDMHTASFARRRTSNHVAQGYRNGRRFVQHPIRGTPAGGLYASVLDMAHFMIMYLNNGLYKNRRILKPQTIARMFAIQNSKMPDFEHKGTPLQGLGWIIGKKPLPGMGRIICHNGRTLTYSADLVLAPRKQLGVIILTNASGKTAKIPLRQIARRALVMAHRWLVEL